jgi:hypothetical protein
MAQPALPTYQTAAHALEGQNGSGARLIGYTALRTVMIAPWFMIGGMPAKQAFFWSALASGTMSIFVLLRIFDARATGLAGIKRPAAPTRPVVRRSPRRRV